MLLPGHEENQSQQSVVAMAWERRGQQRYYYRSVRKNGRVRKIYFGSGKAAQDAAKQDHRQKQKKARNRRRISAIVTQLAYADRLLETSRQDFINRAEQALHEAGFRYHRGSWRRRRAERQPSDSV